MRGFRQYTVDKMYEFDRIRQLVELFRELAPWSHWHTGQRVCWSTSHPDRVPYFLRSYLISLHSCSHPLIANQLKSEWSDLPNSYSANCRHSVPSVTYEIRFANQSSSRDTIAKCCGLRLCHDTLSEHAFKLGLNTTVLFVFFLTALGQRGAMTI